MKVKRRSTGSDPIDSLLKGGVEKGVITNIFGESGTGKTNVCVQIAAEIASKGGKVAYIDTEKGFSSERFVQISDEEALQNIHVMEPTTFREQKKDVKSLPGLVDKESIEAVIVDSLVSLYRLNANGDNISEVNQELSRQLSTLSKIAREANIPIVVTNQVYTSFDEEELELVGRDVPRYWSKCLLKLEYEDKGLRTVEIEKHRSLPEGRSMRFKIENSGLEKVDSKKLI